VSEAFPVSATGPEASVMLAAIHPFQ
jgi:hypothetical protein